MGGLVGDGNPGVTETAPGIGFDAQRGSGLPLCKCDAYHNRAFQSIDVADVSGKIGRHEHLLPRHTCGDGRAERLESGQFLEWSVLPSTITSVINI